MFDKKDLIFYTIAGTALGFITQAAGGGLPAILMTSLIIPPIILIIYRIYRR
jgi:hypothetical protein